MLASMGISCHRVSICSSVWLSITSRCSTETAKRRITQTVPYDSPGTPVFCCRKSQQNSNAVTPNGRANCKWGRLNAGVIAENWPLLTRFVATLVWSQAYQWASTLCVCSTFAMMQRQLILCFFVTNWNDLHQGGAHGGRAPAKITGLFMFKKSKKTKPNGNPAFYRSARAGQNVADKPPV